MKRNIQQFLALVFLILALYLEVELVHFHTTERFLTEEIFNSLRVYYKTRIISNEANDYEVARVINTIEAWEGFLQKYLDGEYEQKAQERIEQLAWLKAKDINTIEAYEEFDAKYPYSGYDHVELERIKPWRESKFSRTYYKYHIKYLRLSQREQREILNKLEHWEREAPEYVKLKIEQLQDPDPVQRGYAAHDLGEKNAKGSILALIDALGDQTGLAWGPPFPFQATTSPGEEAAKALGRIGYVGLEALYVFLESENWIMQRNAARALGTIAEREMDIIGNSTAAEHLLVIAINDNNWKVRKEATEAMGIIGNSEVLRGLIAILNTDESWQVRKQGAEALGRIGKKIHAPSLLQVIVPSLVAALKDKDWRVQKQAGEALGTIARSKSISPPLSGALEAIHHKYRGLQERDVKSFRKMQDLKKIQLLIAELEDADWINLAIATEVLGIIGDERTVEPLIAILKGDYSYYQREEAALALGMVGDVRAVESLVDALNDWDWEVRAYAAKALGIIGDSRAIEPLIDALKDKEWRVWKEAAGALRKITEQDYTYGIAKWKKWWDQNKTKY